jgi:hypothetical protein
MSGVKSHRLCVQLRHYPFFGLFRHDTCIHFAITYTPKTSKYYILCLIYSCYPHHPIKFHNKDGSHASTPNSPSTCHRPRVPPSALISPYLTGVSPQNAHPNRSPSIHAQLPFINKTFPLIKLILTSILHLPYIIDVTARLTKYAPPMQVADSTSFVGYMSGCEFVI